MLPSKRGPTWEHLPGHLKGEVECGIQCEDDPLVDSIFAWRAQQ